MKNRTFLAFLSDTWINDARPDAGSADVDPLIWFSTLDDVAKPLQSVRGVNGARLPVTTTGCSLMLTFRLN